MNIEEFNELTDVEQEEVIFDSGEFLGTDNIENVIFDIYQVNDFYVQFSYDINKQERSKITSFKNPHDMFFFNKMGTFTL